MSAPADPLGQVLAELAELRQKVGGLQAAREKDRGLIAELNTAMRGLTRKLEATPKETEGYTPIPPPRWWRLTAQERGHAVTRLRAWVETVFRPGYGHLAEQLGPCWERHDLCLYLLAWLSEMHTVIFLAPDRMLASEADWHTRLLPAAAAQMATETGKCDHMVPPPREDPGTLPLGGTP